MMGDEKFRHAGKAGLILCLMGVTCCLPWNFFMSAYDYYKLKLTLKGEEGGPPPDFRSECVKVSSLVSDETLAFCRCQDQTAIWGQHDDNNTVVLSQADFAYYSMTSRRDQFAQSLKTAAKPNSGDKKDGPVQTYVNFWNSALSFVTMGTMLAASIVSNSQWLLSKFDQNTRVVYSNYISIVCLAVTVVMIYASFDVPAFFWCTLLIVVLVNITTGVFQTAMFQFCPQLSGDLFTKFIAGQAGSGIIANVCAILGSIVFGNFYPDTAEKPRSSEEEVAMNNAIALFFFLCGIAVIFLAIAGWKILPKLDIIEHYLQLSNNKNQQSDSCDDETKQLQPSTNSPSSSNSNSDHDPEADLIVNRQQNAKQQPVKAKSSWQIIAQAYEYYASIWLCYAVTLAIFPAVVADTKSNYFFTKQDSCGYDQWNPLFFKIGVLLMFNIGDFLGRIFEDYFFFFGVTKENSGYKCLRLAVLRVLFMVFFYFCNLTGSARSNFILDMFGISAFKVHDVLFMFMMIMFGASNGYLSNKAFIFAPERFENPKDKEIAGGLNVTFLTLGLLSGGVCSFATTMKVRAMIGQEMDDKVVSVLFESTYNCLTTCLNS